MEKKEEEEEEEEEKEKEEEEFRFFFCDAPDALSLGVARYHCCLFVASHTPAVIYR